MGLFLRSDHPGGFEPARGRMPGGHSPAEGAARGPADSQGEYAESLWSHHMKRQSPCNGAFFIMKSRLSSGAGRANFLEQFIVWVFDKANRKHVIGLDEVRLGE